MADSKGYVPGDYNAYCDYCEGQYLASQLKKTWDGFMACPKDFTRRNPQDFVRPKTERIVPAWTRSTDGAAAYQIVDFAFNTSGAGTYTITPTDPTINLFNFTATGNMSGATPQVLLGDPQALPVANLDYTFTLTFDASSATNFPGFTVSLPGFATWSLDLKSQYDAQGGNLLRFQSGHITRLTVNKTTNRWAFHERGGQS